MKIVKKISLIILVIILLALDWAALHDILKGGKDPYLEYGMVIFSMIIFGALIYLYAKKSNQRNRST